jgi:glycosyltransferase involved in cell wall biosynthesis
VTAITVITRTKNRLALLRRALRSVRAQTTHDWDHVIVNDGGNPAALEAVLADERHRARVIHHPHSLGMEAASNAALKLASGQHVILLDDDDTWEPECLEKLLAARTRESPNAAVRGAICQSWEVQETLEGDKARETSRKVWNGEFVAIDLGQLVGGNLFTNNAFLVDRTAIESLGGFDAALPVYGDWDFNLRFFSKYEAAVIPQALAGYHRRVMTAGDQANSFARDPALAGRARAQLVRRWLAGEHGRNASVGMLLAIAPQLKQSVDAAARIDKVLNALHRIRKLAGLSWLDRAFSSD